MKKIFNVIVLTLAMNFLALAGGIGWLYQSGRLDKERAAAIKEIIFPAATTAPTTQEAELDPENQPHTIRLEELLAVKAGRSAEEQVNFIQNTFDAQMAMLDRRQRELNDLQKQIELAKQQAAVDRTKLQQDQSELLAQKEEAKRLAADKGFQDSLQLYGTMPPKQVKTIFMTLDDPTLMRYLQAMQPRQAGKIIKEFKSPEEIERIQKVLEKMRTSQQASTKE